MILLQNIKFKFRQKPAAAWKAVQSSRGAISVEYALCMVVAGIFMMGVERLFRNMAVDVLSRFVDMVSQFPNM